MTDNTDAMALFAATWAVQALGQLLRPVLAHGLAHVGRHAQLLEALA